MTPIHLRDAQFKNQALHFHYAGFPEPQLTDDPEKVTCKTCLRMLRRAEGVFMNKQKGG
ncbi:hypothetical protein ES705_38971 [subsurface metagenome]